MRRLIVNMKEFFSQKGTGIMGTADRKGRVNLAIYSPPIVLDNQIVVFGATKRKTYENLKENPHAMFMYILDKPGWEGIRLELKLVKVEDEGEMLERIKENFTKIGYNSLAKEIAFALYFEVVNRFPLKGR